MEMTSFGLVARKHVFGISACVRLETACSATETNQNVEGSYEASLDIIITNIGADQTGRMRRLVCAFNLSIFYLK